MAVVRWAVIDSQQKPLAGVLLSAVSPNGDWQGLTNCAGEFYSDLQPGHYDVTFSKSGYTDRVLPADIQDCGTITTGLESAVPDWTRAQLLAVKGSLWTQRLNLPYGPRPGQDDNILAMDYYEMFSPSDQRRMLAAFQGTHAATGPLVDGGYHGQYPASDLRDPAAFDAYLDRMEEWWQRNLCPVHFCKPDGWTLAQLETLTPLYQTPRAQQLLRFVVPAGWEPDISTPNSDYVGWLKWGRETFPNAVIGLHMPADHDGPGNHQDVDHGIDIWGNVAPYVDAWLVQNAAFADPTGIAENGKTNYQNFVAQFDPNAGRDSLRWRINQGWLPPVKLIAGEYASYWCYWNNRPFSEAQAWGNAAMQAGGCDGYFDGGTA